MGTWPRTLPGIPCRAPDAVLGECMAEPAARYRQLLREAKLSFEVEEEPSLCLSSADAWTNCTIRYLVPARERRRWATNLLLAISQESIRAEHQGKIITAYPQTEVQLRGSGPNADAIQSEAGKEPLVVQRK
jgi:small conductance mechanosensitive channel